MCHLFTETPFSNSSKVGDSNYFEILHCCGKTLTVQSSAERVWKTFFDGWNLTRLKGSGTQVKSAVQLGMEESTKHLSSDHYLL